MTKDIFKILSRFLAGEASLNDVLRLSDWLNQDEHNRRRLMQLKRFWDSPVELAELEKPETAFGKFDKRLTAPVEPKTGISRRIWVVSTVAASIALLIVVSLSIFHSVKERQPVDYYTYTCRNGVDRMVLPDSTVVYLNKDSRITYASNYGKNRWVRLDGEAYFDVMKELGTFTVDVGSDASIEVLGTKFNVVAFSGKKQVITTLEEGSVRFVKGGQQIMLAPDQQLVYNVDMSGHQIRQVDTDVFTAWKEHVYKYNSITMLELCQELERFYDVKIDLSSRLKNIKVSGSFEYRHNIEQILNVMEKRMQFKWKRKGNHITIQ